MRILALNGSPREDGHTAELLGAALEEAGRLGLQPDLLHLADYDIRRCRGCYACAKGPCPQHDDMSRLLIDIRGHQADGLLYGAPVFNFNLPGMLIDFWNRRTGMSGYFRARQEGWLNEWLAQNRHWKVGAAIVQAGHSGGQKTALKHVNFMLLAEVERVLPGLATHTAQGNLALEEAAALGRRMAMAMRASQGPYPLWQLPFIYKRRTCFEFPGR